MNKFLGLLSISTLLTLSACEESSTTPATSSLVDSCTLAGGGICSETASGEIKAEECIAKLGTFSDQPCISGEKLKCTNQAIPGRTDITSTAYIYQDLWIDALNDAATQVGSSDPCDGIAPLMQSFQ